MSIIFAEKPYKISSSIYPSLYFGRESKIRIDLSSRGIRPIEIVDNCSNHAPNEQNYRITTGAINRESINKIGKETLFPGKVDQSIELLDIQTSGMMEGQTVILEVATSSGTQEMSLTRMGDNLLVTVTGDHIPVIVPMFDLFSFKLKNKRGEFADLSRAILMIVVRYSHPTCIFIPGKTEDKKAFTKLKRFLWPT